MSKAIINNFNMHYEIHGEGEPLVLIAGFGGDSSTWAGVRDLFAKQYQVIVFDNRGTGQSDVPDGPYSIDQLAHDVVALCEHLKISKAHFVGNSMGGHIVQTLAHQYPQFVHSAVICNSVMTPDVPFRFFAQGKLELLKARAPLDAMVKISCSWGFSAQFLSQAGRMESLIDLALKNPYPFSLKAYEAQLAALKVFDSSQWAHTISVPTLVLGADQDIIFREALVKALADAIPGAEYHCFQNCGHIPYLEYPEEFVTVVSGFCQ